MPSSKRRNAAGPDGELPSGPAAWLLDAHDDLVSEPRLLVDAPLLGAVHAELGSRLGLAEAEGALLQIGFVLGLRDAQRVMQPGFRGIAARPASPAAPTLSMTLDTTADLASGGALRGHWPSSFEARARTRLLGPADAPVCRLSGGYTAGWLSGLLDLDVVVVEEHCIARGDDACRFVARAARAVVAEDDPEAHVVRCALPFDDLRERVAREIAEDPDAPQSVAVDPDSPAIHVWGPVMVVPFGGADDALRAIDLIGRDPAARDVAVVVIDLTGTIVDDGFGALALENVLDAIEAWGAEPVLASVCPGSQRVVAELERHHLVVRKDLSAAVASAFQIAAAQRRFS